MAAYAIVDVDVHDIAHFIVYQRKVAPLLQAVGARYLARGGEFRVYEGDYEPGSLIILEFPSMDIMDEFYESEDFQSLNPERDACSSSRIVAVKGLNSFKRPGSPSSNPDIDQ